MAMAGIGCSASTLNELSSRQLDGGLQGLAAHDYEFWEEWTSRQPASMAVGENLKPVTVFDAWRIDDAAFREPVWDATFHVLDALRAAVSDESQQRALQSLMLRLEPGLAEVEWEAAFVSQKKGHAEGIVLRMATPKGVGLWIEGQRLSGDSNTAKRWTLRAEPAAEEVPGMTVWWAHNGERWQAEVAYEAGARRPTSPLENDMGWGPFIKAWESALWQALSDREYLEPSFERIDGKKADLAPGWSASLGQAVQMRGLDDFVRDTVFAPRTTGDTLEQFND